MDRHNEIPFSKHIFMFAFKWNYMEGSSRYKKNKYRQFREKINLQKFDEKLINKKNDIKSRGKTAHYRQSSWIRDTYQEKRIRDYNEYTYYYHNVRDAIYSNNPSSDLKSKKVNIYHYHIPSGYTPQYIIKISPNKYHHHNPNKLEQKKESDEMHGEKVYTLNMIKIELKVYDTGVAVLSFFADNYEENTIEAVNHINNYGRRIYPQFIKQQGGKDMTQITKNAFLPNSQVLKLGEEKEKCFEENFLWDYELEGNRISNIIMGLLGKGFKTGKDAHRKHLEDMVTVSPLIDDRMFVICWYNNKALVDKLRQITYIEGKGFYSYIKNDKWYEYIFMENEKSCQSKWMMEKILQEHTYERWIEYGTLYGMSYCSFVCLSDGNRFSADHISVHMMTVYYQMMCLVLAQKASILRFEDELTDISNHSQDIPIEAVEQVYQNYLQFINGIYFREVTAQDQGIELYGKAQHLMRIDSDVKELKEEIEHLFQYVSLRTDKDTGQSINILTYLNTLILVPALVTGFFGMNIFGDGLRETWSITDYKKLVIWGCTWIITVGVLPLAIIKTKIIQKLFKKIPEPWLTLMPWMIIAAAVLTAKFL